MTPKEKAKELVDKYNQFDFNTIVNSTQKEYAKQCAFIAVDEILYIMKEEYLSGALKIEYWEQVKQEIEIL